MSRTEESPGAPRPGPNVSSSLPSSFALTVLVALAVVSPWPFARLAAGGSVGNPDALLAGGGVHPLAVHILSVVALAASLVALVLGAVRGGLLLPAVPLWPALGLLALGLLHQAPLPPGLHALGAPASYEVWHPSEPAAAALLGDGSHPISVDPGSTLRWLGLTGGLVCLALLSVPALSQRTAARRATVMVVIGGVAVAVYGIVARSLFGPLLYGRVPVPTLSPFGPFVNKNHFAGYVAMAALLCLGLVAGLADRERARRPGADWTGRSRATAVVAALVAALAMALGVLVSLSRGGLLSLLAGCLAFLAVRWRVREPSGPRSRLLPSLAVSVALACLLVAVLPQEAHERMRSLAGAGADQSGSFRLDTWRDVLRMAAASPWVGQGMGSFHDAFPRFKRGHGEVQVEHPENEYLEVLAEGGLLGLALVLSAALVLAVPSLRGIVGSHEPLARGIRIGALAGLAGLAVHGLLDFNLRIPSNAALAALLAAIAVGSAGLRPAPVRPAAAWVVAALLGLSLWRLVSLPEEPWPLAQEASRAAESATSPEGRRLRLRQAESALRSAVDHRPAHPDPWLLLAWTRAVEGKAAVARSLARYALSLDPGRKDLRSGAEELIRWSEGSRE